MFNERSNDQGLINLAVNSLSNKTLGLTVNNMALTNIAQGIFAMT